MKAHYDPEVDILYIKVGRGPVYDSEEVNEDIRLEYDKKRRVVAIEITNARHGIARALAKGIAEELKATVAH